MSSITGHRLQLQIFGESHGFAVGFVLNGLPAGTPVRTRRLREFLSRRRPGKKGTTPRKETDTPVILSGVKDGRSNGNPLTMIFKNKDYSKKDYDNLKYIPRPSHGDYGTMIKYRGFGETEGGGHYSGRLTLPITAAGALVYGILEEKGISSYAALSRIGTASFPVPEDPSPEEIRALKKRDLPVFADEKGAFSRLEALRREKDSAGSELRIVFNGVPAGLGEPFFGGADSRIAGILMAVPGVKSVGFGLGEDFAIERGSRANDFFTYEDGRVTTKTNHNGGILSGLTTGRPVVVRCVFKPTPSIGLPQKSVDLNRKENTELTVEGRHDPCIGIRGAAAAEAAVAFVLADLILENDYGFK